MMTKPTSRPTLFERLCRGLNESIRHARGEMELRTTEVRVPSPPVVDAQDVVALRAKLGIDIPTFAELLGVTTADVSAFESSQTTPSGPVRRLIEVYGEHPSLVASLLNQTPKSQQPIIPSKRPKKARTKPVAKTSQAAKPSRKKQPTT